MEIPDPKYPFFSRLIHFTNAGLKARWIVNSPDDRTKISCNRGLHVEVHCVVIEYENGKVKPAHYLIQIVDLNDPNDQQQERFSE